MFSTFEPRDLHFAQLCKTAYPGKQWKDLSNNERVVLFREALKPPAVVIDPNSTFIKVWDGIVVFSLLYTAIVCPFEVAFLQPTWWDSVFTCNRIIDVIFFADLCTQFFRKVRVSTRNGTTWLRTRRRIVKRYLKTWFLIDFVSVIPFDLILLSMGSRGLSQFKSLKMVRLIRFLRLLRVMKASVIVRHWQNSFSISFAQIAIAKFVVGLLVVSHWTACLWGFVGKSMATLEDDVWCNDDGVWQWTPEKGEYSFDGASSWITKLYYKQGVPKLNSDDPCNVWDLWIVSYYFSILTITSIGYGDIVATRREEYISLICIMLLGGFLWAHIIGSFCGVISSLNPFQLDYEEKVTLMNHMLSDQNFDQDVRRRFRNYLREASHLHKMERYTELVHSLSPELRGEFYTHVTRRSLRKIWYFKNLSQNFLVAVAMRMQTKMFERHEHIPIRESLCVVERGCVANLGTVLVVGSTWGEDLILSHKSLRYDTNPIAMTYCEIKYLERYQLQDCLQEFPEDAKKVRSSTVKLAIIRGVINMVRNESLAPNIILPTPGKMAERRNSVASLFHVQSGSERRSTPSILWTDTVVPSRTEQPLPRVSQSSRSCEAVDGSTTKISEYGKEGRKDTCTDNNQNDSEALRWTLTQWHAENVIPKNDSDDGSDSESGNVLQEVRSLRQDMQTMHNKLEMLENLIMSHFQNGPQSV